MPLKRRLSQCSDRDGSVTNSTYKFQIQLPDGTTTHLSLHDPCEEMEVTEFINAIRKGLERDSNRSGSGSGSGSGSKRRKIRWNRYMYLEDVFGKKISSAVHFSRFPPNKCHLLTLHENTGDSVETFKNTWDLTPDTDFLEELPAEYTFAAALAGLIDNSLEAVWSNGNAERRFIKVLVDKEMIDIFDTGPGMDGTEDNSIAKWGKMCSSNHGVDGAMCGEPPYLQNRFGTDQPLPNWCFQNLRLQSSICVCAKFSLNDQPSFGFGYGARHAAMHLGRNITVFSKTKQCGKVYTLHLSEDSLLKMSSSSRCTWKADGGIRNLLKDEKELSPHGSFTRVKICDFEMTCPNPHKLQCLLKDIYFPYIQCDEPGNSNKTATPVEFQVNDMNLAEVSGGEVATANLYSCNGPDFVFQLNFLLSNEEESVTRVGNARLKFVYFPIVEGQEGIVHMLKELKKDGYDIKEQFETYSRVSVRRLGRLLPDARWKQLPLMDFKPRVENEALTLKSCLKRIKCFVDTDAGFTPTPSKTDLTHEDPFTLALKNFGSKPVSKDKENQGVSIEISKNGETLSILQLQRDYKEWVIQMHEQYDQEIECGEDNPIVILSPTGKRELGITQDVIRVHKAIRRMGKTWKSDQKVRVSKGAIGSKVSMYATLEYVVVEGLLGDAGGEVHLICRPIGIPNSKGCKISNANGENPTIEIQKSVSFPISFIDTRMIVAIDENVFCSQLQKHLHEISSIEILTNEHHKELATEPVLSFEAPVIAGHSVPEKLVAILRHASSTSLISSPLSDQKSIMKVDSEMSLDIEQTCQEDAEFKYGKVVFSRKEKSTSHGGVNGLYIFALRNLLQLSKAGLYKFTFSASFEELGCKQMEKILTVKPDEKSAKWKFCNNTSLSVRVGACLPPISIKCHDSFGNVVPFGPISQIKLNICCGDHVLAEINPLKVDVPDQASSFTISDVEIKSSKLDKIRQHRYTAVIEVTSHDGLYSASASCRVLPGTLDHVKLRRAQLEKYLAPGRVVKDLVLEMFDSFENHIEEGTEVAINVYNLSFQDNVGSSRKVNSNGCVDLSGLLKVEAGYGSEVCLSVSTEGKDIFRESFKVPERQVHAVAEVDFPQVTKMKLESPRTPHRLSGNSQPASSPMSCLNDESYHTYCGYTEKLLHEVKKTGLKIGELERSILVLSKKKAALQNEISVLRAKLGEPYDKHFESLEDLKEALKQKIVQLCPGTMASALVHLPKTAVPNLNLRNELKADCDGLVALLATVTDLRLSRVLAKYLGENLMLSVVSNKEGSRSFVQYDANGEINKNYGIYKVASTLKVNIDKPFSVIALDEIRPYVGELCNQDTQKKLAIPHPRSPQHQTGPAGFVGYAVNLLNFTTIKVNLRATLFYRLFGQLQVYQTRYDMEQAHDCIREEGAVSLDGAIMRRPGILSHGDQEPKITFPVVAPLPKNISEENVVDIITELRKKNELLEALEAAYQKELQICEATHKEFLSKCDHLQTVMPLDQME